MPPAMALPKDAKELFDDRIPGALSSHPQEAREVDAIYCFKISGEGGGDWTVDLTADPPSVAKGDRGDAQCTIEVSHEDFKSMLTDPQAGMQLYFQGKLRVTGAPELAAKLNQFFELAARDPA